MIRLALLAVALAATAGAQTVGSPLVRVTQGGALCATVPTIDVTGGLTCAYDATSKSAIISGAGISGGGGTGTAAPISVTIPTPAATDDFVPFPFIAPATVTLQSVSCRVGGACPTPPTYTLQDDNGGAITVSGSLVCAAGATAATAVTITGGATVTAGHGFLFSTTNTPSCAFAVLSVFAVPPSRVAGEWDITNWGESGWQ